MGTVRTGNEIHTGSGQILNQDLMGFHRRVKNRSLYYFHAFK